MISEDQLNRMITSGVKVISSGANVPFADPEIFFGKIAEKADASLALIPDFIANCGMARVFAYLMSNDLKSIEDCLIFEDTSEIIKKALQNTKEINSNSTGIAKAAFEIALKQLI
jgi:glutamate dehydrogenase/leucine dehydrogenase